jgi:prepilin-type N-terminal cleavage/methylation domain-containing protein
MKNYNGFTILEMLVTLSIIGILAGLSLPQLMHVIKARQSVGCAVNRIDIQNAEHQFVVDYGRPSATIGELMQNNYISAVPQCPAGGIYMWIKDATEANLFRNLGCSIHYFPSSLPAGSNILFASDFDNMNGLNPLVGKWQIKDGSLVPIGSGENRLAFGDRSWKDYTVKVNATLTDGNGYGVYYRTDGNSNITGYVFQYDPGLGNKFVVRKVVNGNEQGPFQQVNMPKGFPIYNQSHDIIITVRGDRQIISIDGQTILDFRDSAFSSGTAGLRSWGNSNVVFDDVIITP